MWYSAKKDQTESTSLGGQDSNPLKYSSLNNFSCLCFIAALVSGGLGAHLMPLSCQSTLVALAPMWPQLLSLLRSSSSGSRDTPYYFSLLWQHSCCHHATLFKYSVLSGPGIMTHLQHVGPESSYSAPHQCKLSPSLHV